MQKSTPLRHCFVKISQNWKLVVSSATCVATALITLAAASPPDANAILQEPFLVKLKQPLRHSPALLGEIGQVKAVARTEGLVIDAWFASADGLVMRMRSSTDLDRTRKEATIRRLKQLPAVELVTTASAGPGVLQPALLAQRFASDADIPEASLRGFRELDKADHEARLDLNAPHARGVLVVRTKEESLFGSSRALTLTRSAADHARLGNRATRTLAYSELDRAEIVEFDEDSVPIAEMIRRYDALPWVEYAEPDYLVTLNVSVNDPLANGGDGYHLEKIHAPEAWDLQHDTNEIVAVLDTGLYTGHPDIAGNVFSDLSGTNLISNNGNPVDDQPHGYPWGHGTHVSGIIGAKGNNGTGLAGVAWTVKLLPIKVFDSTGQENLNTATRVTQAIRLAVAKGAKIINCSFSVTYTQEVALAIRDARDAGAAIVAAAGNTDPPPSPTPEPTVPPRYQGEGWREPGGLDSISTLSSGPPNNDDYPQYPAASEYPNVIAVANTNSSDVLDPTSKYGAFTVDVAAPGTQIKSTVNQNNADKTYEYLTGTSQAAPHVSGTLALVRERLLDPNGVYRQSQAQVTFWDVLDRIRMGVNRLSSLDGGTPEGELRDSKGFVSTGGRLNAYKALLTRSKMANESCRAMVESGDGIVINGFVLRDRTTVLVRGIGPSLSNFGVPGALQDPILELHDSSGALIASNDNWRLTQEGAIQATGIPPSNDSESAILMELQAGSYTVQLRGVGGGQGIAVNEVYELSDGANPANDLKRTVNLSERVMVRGGDQIAILGLIVTGQQPRRVLFRALGPTLGNFGVSGALADPRLELFDSNGHSLAQNNNWRYRDSAQTQFFPQIYQDKVTRAGFKPTFDAEPIIIATLPPGSYTIHCNGADMGSGIAVIEAYEY